MNFTTAAKDEQWMNKVSAKNDSFTRLHEDPILRIKQQEKMKMESIVNNPIKMDKIRQQILLDLEKKNSEKSEKKRKKKEHKEAKKDKKRRKKEGKQKDGGKSKEEE